MRNTGSWPARLVDVENTADAERQLVLEDINALNSEADEVLVNNEGGGASDAAPILIRKVADWTEAPSRAGLATTDGTGCTVQIAARVFGSSYSSFRRTVVWHELAHCAGLPHVDAAGELMSPTTWAFSQYSAEKLERFIEAFAASAGLAKP